MIYGPVSVMKQAGQLHVVKNTIFKKALDKAGYTYTTGFAGRSIIGFAKENAPTMAKVLNEACKGPVLEFKTGLFMDHENLCLLRISNHG